MLARYLSQARKRNHQDMPKENRRKDDHRPELEAVELTEGIEGMHQVGNVVPLGDDDFPEPGSRTVRPDANEQEQ
jgi:hypothetical protein